jgi:hypothetical protein
MEGSVMSEDDIYSRILKKPSAATLACVVIAFSAIILGSDYVAAIDPNDDPCFQICPARYDGDSAVLPGYDRTFSALPGPQPMVGYKHTSRNGNIAYSAWGPWEARKFVLEDGLLADVLPGQKSGRNGWVVFGAHGQYGEDFYNEAFGGRNIPEKRRLVAASCNENFDLYSPFEKVARKNPGHYAFGIRPDALDILWKMTADGSGWLHLSFEGVNGAEVPENVFAVGRWDPKKEKLVWRAIPDQKAREWLAQHSVDFKGTPSEAGNARGCVRGCDASDLLPDVDITKHITKNLSKFGSQVANACRKAGPAAEVLGTAITAAEVTGNYYDQQWRAETGQPTGYFRNPWADIGVQFILEYMEGSSPINALLSPYMSINSKTYLSCRRPPSRGPRVTGVMSPEY